MPESRSQRPRAVERVQPQRDQLREAHHRFAQVWQMPEVSADALQAALDGLRAAFEVHVAYAEGEGGLFEELLDDAPAEAAPEVDRLKRDHEMITSVTDRLVSLLAAGVPPGDARVSETAGELVRLVGQHRQRGAALLYNVYGVDMGAGD